MMRPTVLKNVALAEQLSTLLAADIFGGKILPGNRLPTEEKLASEFKVSRSVVREAIARMKSDGLVETRQGLGAFVAQTFAAVPFRLPAGSADRPKEVKEVLELRIGVEAEAAALAAERATPEQLGEIHAALLAVNDSAGSDGAGIEEDLRFHRAIATAANNHIYDKFIAFLELHVRDQLEISRGMSKVRGRLDLINDEHQAIYAAICSRDPHSARNAVLTHLRNGIDRLAR